MFVSYSHRDRDWLDRLLLHLAVLQRRELVHIWSDVRIGIGAAWEEEIEGALTDSQVTVLLVSPGFLASEFIWKEEMPRIIVHKAQGMEVLPLIVKPCAWRLEKDLSRLQARPAEARPLSLASEAQVDLDLSAFVYELAAKIKTISSAAAILATQGWELAEQHRMSSGHLGTQVTDGEPDNSPDDDVATLIVPTGFLDCPPQSWTGTYNSDYHFRFTIRERTGRQFRGSIEYLTEDTVTSVEGNIVDRTQVTESERRWSSLSDEAAEDQFAIIFRELGYEKRGARQINFHGEYLAFVSGSRMSGGWFEGDRLVGRFVATLDGSDTPTFYEAAAVKPPEF